MEKVKSFIIKWLSCTIILLYWIISHRDEKIGATELTAVLIGIFIVGLITEWLLWIRYNYSIFRK